MNRAKIVECDSSQTTKRKAGRCRLDLLKLKRIRFPFRRKNLKSRIDYSWVQDNKEQATNKDSLIAEESQAALRAVLLGSWKEQKGIFLEQNSVRAGSYFSSKYHDFYQESADDGYVTLKPARLSTYSLENVEIDEEILRHKINVSSVPKNIVKNEANSDKTALLSSLEIQSLETRQKRSLSPNGRKRCSAAWEDKIDACPFRNFKPVDLNTRKPNASTYAKKDHESKDLKDTIMKGKNVSEANVPSKRIRASRLQRDSDLEKYRNLSARANKAAKRKSLTNILEYPIVTCGSKFSKRGLQDSSGITRPATKFARETLTIDIVLRNKLLLKDFKKFLAKEHSEENLDFWLECETYRKEKQETRIRLAPKIYATYLEEKSPREVNIDGKTKEEIFSRMLHADEGTFIPGQEQIYRLMKADSFPRFISSLN